MITVDDYDIPFEIVFDENPILGPRAKSWWPVIRAMQTPQVKALLPVEPMLRNDEQWLPLQAADLTAWMALADKRGDNPLAWVRNHMPGVSPVKPTIWFGAREVALMFGDDGPIPPEMQWKVDAARQAFAEVIDSGAWLYGPKVKPSKGRP